MEDGVDHHLIAARKFQRAGEGGARGGAGGEILDHQRILRNLVEMLDAGCAAGLVMQRRVAIGLGVEGRGQVQPAILPVEGHVLAAVLHHAAIEGHAESGEIGPDAGEDIDTVLQPQIGA